MNTGQRLLDRFPRGSYFLCGNKPWKVTDIGTRVLVAIEYKPGWMDGPPYAVLETVFDQGELHVLVPIVQQPGMTMDETIEALMFLSSPVGRLAQPPGQEQASASNLKGSPMNNPPVNILPKNTIRQIESGERKVQLIYRDQLAERLGISPKERLTLTLMEPTGEPVDGKVLLLSALIDGGDLTTDQEQIYADFLKEVGINTICIFPEKPVTS